jgi:hypothetical protein
MNSNSILSAPEDIFNFLNLSSMKRFTFILCFFLSIVTAFCQQFTCINVNKSFSGDGNAGSYIWGIQNLVTGAFVNGSVATISGGVTQFGVAVAGHQQVMLLSNLQKRVSTV